MSTSKKNGKSSNNQKGTVGYLFVDNDDDYFFKILQEASELILKRRQKNGGN